MLNEAKTLCGQLDRSVENLMNELQVLNEDNDKLSRDNERLKETIKSAGAWMDQHWGIKYDSLPTPLKRLIDAKRKLEAVSSE